MQRREISDIFSVKLRIVVATEKCKICVCGRDGEGICGKSGFPRGRKVSVNSSQNFWIFLFSL